MDIRNFFGSKLKTKSKDDGEKEQSNGDQGKRKRPKPLLSDSSDDEEDKERNSRTRSKNSKGRPKPKILSDSDDDDFAPKCNGKSKKKVSPKQAVKKTLKPVDAKDFFAKTAPKPLPDVPKEKNGSKEKSECKRKSSEKSPEKEKKKRKMPEEELHDDPDFAALLESMDNDDMYDDAEVRQSPRKKAKKEHIKKTPVVEEVVKQVVKQEKKPSTKKEKVVTEKSKKVTSPVKQEKKPSPEKEKEKVKPSPVKKQKAMAEMVKKSPVKAVVKKEIHSAPSTSSSLPQEGSGDVLLWVDKYKPTNLKGIIGQQGDRSNMRKLLHWLQNWSKHHGNSNKKPPPRPPPNFGGHGNANDDGGWAKAALLSGPPGVGKTTTSYLVAKELGYDIMELNASDTRSKKQLDSCLTDALNSQSVSKTSTKRVLLMDEVDGMAGNEDRGGMAELIQLLKQSRIPVICMCNDRNHSKIRSLANHCYDLRFYRPRPEQIKAAMMSICFKEKLKVDPNALSELIVGCNQDVRQVLHHLTMLKANDEEKFTMESAKKEVQSAHKTSIKMGPWDVTKKVFSASDHKNMSLMDKSDLFFHDYSIGPLFVQENYLSSSPDAAKYDSKKAIVLASRAADSIADGDLVDKTIRSNNSWNLLPTQAMFASVIPGEYMAGQLHGQIQFPQWLGKYSKQGKMDRILQELQVHTRLKAGLSKSALNQEFVQHLKNAITSPLATKGPDGVADAVQVMDQYSLLREDLDNLLEVTQWPGQPDPLRGVESKVKAAFTRAYNKEVILPYAKTAVVTKKAKVDAPEGFEEEGEEQEEQQDADDVESDAMIKAKKPKKTKEVDKPGTATRGRGRGRGRGGKK